MGIRKWWKLLPTPYSAGCSLIHEYDADGKFVGAEYKATLKFVLEKDPNRYLVRELTEAETVEMIDGLTKSLASVRTLNGKIGSDPAVADDRPMTSRERAALLTNNGDGSKRTGENIAYTNGRHAERAGWVPYSFEMFCRKFHHETMSERSRRYYESFQTGRRAEALEASAKG